jgi:hypothetical protein
MIAALKTDEAESALAEHLAAMRRLRAPAPANRPAQPAGSAGASPEGAAEAAPDRSTAEIEGWLAEDIIVGMFEHFGSWHFGRDEYELASEDQYRALGEEPCSDDTPLILCRKRDGAFFEVEIDVTARETSAQSRQEWRDRLSSGVRAACVDVTEGASR